MNSTKKSGAQQESQLILVIDDDQHYLANLEKAISAWGYEVITASTVNEGLLLTFSRSPDLIVCDIKFPEPENGFKLLETARNSQLSSGIPIILITASVEISILKQSLALGADGCLLKPFSLSELKNAIESRLRRNEQIQSLVQSELNELRGSLSTMLPHELLTPLAGIISVAELMCADGITLSPQEVKSLSQAILQSSERLHRLVQRFLQYSKLQLAIAGQDFSFYRNGDLTESCSSITARIAERFHRSDDLDMVINLEACNAIAEAVEIVLSELLDNGFKFSKPGNKVLVRVHSNPESVHITVADSGCGFPPEEHNHIAAFRQFGRKKNEHQGTGLGLAIVSQIVALLNGSIAFEPNNPGTQVTVILPSVRLTKSPKIT